jgi:hypothetical protein
MQTLSLPTGPMLRRVQVARLPLAAGRWLVQPYLEPTAFSDFRLLADVGIVASVYLITDGSGRVRWLGQASRNDDLVSRLAASC